ncbi:MAG: MMPL family transporter [Acidobacteria bacterium]|nr:MMPL family transporter [Acidobacteriota bacterium]MBV9186616.1 MMPL family transporter [Acidobacteriota bacterium]
MTDRILDALARLCLRRNKEILIAAFVLAVLAVLGATRLSFDPDLLNLIPQQNKQVNEFRKVLKDLGTIDYHIVLMDMPKGRDVHDYDTLIDAVAEGYRKNPRIEDVTYKIPNPLDFIEIILPKAFLFLTPAELDQVSAKLTDEGIRASVARNAAMLQTPQATAMKPLVQYDPFNFLPIFLRKFQSAGGGFSIDTSSGYYMSSDHSMLLILTKPRRPAQDVPFGKKLLNEGTLIEAEALRDFQKTAAPGTPLPRISHTGGYEIAAGDADLIRQDVIINILGTVFGVLALFLYAFRRPASIIYAGAPLALGLLLTFGMAGVTYGKLSQASAGFAALLAGLGIDFITVLYGRYVDERNRGTSMQESIRTIMRSTMPGVFVAAITTAGTFFAFLATDFRGMTQLGFLTGVGILLFLLCVMFLLPALIVFSERKESRRAPKLYLHSFGAGKLIDLSVARPLVTIGVWAVFIVACGIMATRVRFSDNIQDLRAKGNPGVVNQSRITEKFGQSFDFMMYVCEGKTLEEALEKTRTASKDLDALVADHTIASYQSISTFLPPVVDQEKIIARLHAGAANEFNIARIEKTFRAALVANGFRPEVYDDYLKLFAQTLQPPQPITLQTIGNEDITKLTTRFVKKVGGGWMSVINVYPTGGKWPRDVPAKLMAVPDRHPGDVLTGVNLVSGTLRRIVKADATRSTIIGFVAVLVLMFVSFRNLKLTLLSFVPFVAGAVGMLGLMALLNLQFNFMNIFVGLMIIGVATDYAIYMLQRYQEDPVAFRASAHETGKAIVMASLTAIVGYGAFAFSHYPGLRSIGYASTFGIGLSGLAAITLLPAILVMGRRNDER